MRQSTQLGIKLPQESQDSGVLEALRNSCAVSLQKQSVALMEKVGETHWVQSDTVQREQEGEQDSQVLEEEFR